MNKQEFEELYVGKYAPDKEYDAYYELWCEYIEFTDYLLKAMSKEAYKEYCRLFTGLPRNEKFERAKCNAWRLHN